MRLTHFGHACLFLETESARILINPGPHFSGFETEPVDAVLITRRNPASNGRIVGELMERNPNASLWVEASMFLESGFFETGYVVGHDRTNGVHPGDVFHINETKVRAVGDIHACIHRDIGLVRHVGYFFPDEQVLHRGDKIVIHGSRLRVLEASISKRWPSLRRTADHLRAVDERTLTCSTRG